MRYTATMSRYLAFAVFLSGLLSGCWVDNEDLAARLDADDDGSPWPEDCDTGNAAVFPGAIEECNDIDDDCDGVVDESWTGILEASRAAIVESQSGLFGSDLRLTRGILGTNSYDVIIGAPAGGAAAVFPHPTAFENVTATVSEAEGRILIANWDSQTTQWETDAGTTCTNQYPTLGKFLATAGSSNAAISHIVISGNIPSETNNCGISVITQTLDLTGSDTVHPVSIAENGTALLGDLGSGAGKYVELLTNDCCTDDSNCPPCSQAMLAVGAPDGMSGTGLVYILEPTQLATMQSSFAYLGQAAWNATTFAGGTGDFVGVELDSAGDIDGDGLAELLIGGRDNYIAYLVWGEDLYGAHTLTPRDVIGLTLVRGGEGSYSGRWLSGGDLNNDGHSDPVVIAYQDGSHSAMEVAVVLDVNTQLSPGSSFEVPTNGQRQIARFIPEKAYDEGPEEALSVSASTDVTGDNIADLLVGAERTSWLVAGGEPGDFDDTDINVPIRTVAYATFAEDTLLSDPDGSTMFGYSIAGGVLGDGTKVVVIGAPEPVDEFVSSHVYFFPLTCP